MMVNVIISKYYEDIVNKLATSIKEELKKNKIEFKITEVSGVWEIPYEINRLSNLSKDNTEFIAVGVLLKGETDHYKYIAENTTYGIQKVSLEKNKPIIFGVLTVNNIDQAEARIKSSTTYAENLVEMVCNY